MKILIDLQGYQSASRNRGIGRYSLAFAKAVAKNAGRHEVWLLLNGLFPDTLDPIRDEFFGLIPYEHIIIFHVPGPVAEMHPANSVRARTAELMREEMIAKLKPDIVHLTSLFEGHLDDAVTSIGLLKNQIATSVIVYDLIPFLYPDIFLVDEIYKTYYLKKIDSLKRANLMLSISSSSGEEAISSLSLDSERIVNVSSAADNRFRVIPDASELAGPVLSRYGICTPFIMSASVIEPRKNQKALIDAFLLLPCSIRITHQLVLVGHVTDSERVTLQNYTASLGLHDSSLIMTGYLPDEELVLLYNLCELFVFPSLHEGFGLPLLEAMSCGAPVIGSNASSIPEVIGMKEALFDPSSPKDIAILMEKALTDRSWLGTLRQHALFQSARFSWDETARKAIQAFEKLNEGKINPLP